MGAYQPFLNVYIVWHPVFRSSGQTGGELAEKLYREFCRDPEKPMSPVLGIPFYFRTSHAEGVAPAAIDLGDAQRNVIVLFADSSMVLDDTYRKYANDLAQTLDNKQHRI